jgi:hypothetical protein
LYRSIVPVLKEFLGEKPLENRVNLNGSPLDKKSLETGSRCVVTDDVRTSERPAAVNSGASVPLPPLETFFSRFRDDNDCLEYLWRARCSIDGTTAMCPECGDTREFRAGVDTTAHLQWQCVWCGCFLSPLAGTLFQKTRIPLHVYFDAMGVLAEPGRPLRAEELAYELGVGFATALELIEALDGRLDATDVASPRFMFDLASTEDLLSNY